jgi:hypothetical protein
MQLKTLNASARNARKLIAVTVGLLTLAVQPAAAFHTECDYPAVFSPVLRLLHDLTSLVQVAGLILAVLGLSVAGLIYITRFGGPNSVERARRIARNVILGASIMLMSEPIVAYLAQQLPGAC